VTQTRVNNATSLHIQTSYALLKPKQGVILFTPDTILCLESGVNTSWHIAKHMAWCRLFISVCFVPTSSGIQEWTVFRCQQSGLFYILLVMNFKVQWQKHLFPIRLIHPYFFSFTAVRPAGFAELLFFLKSNSIFQIQIWSVIISDSSAWCLERGRCQTAHILSGAHAAHDPSMLLWSKYISVVLTSHKHPKKKNHLSWFNALTKVHLLRDPVCQE